MSELCNVAILYHVGVADPPSQSKELSPTKYLTYLLLSDFIDINL
jgi:hypothetical protein